MSTTIRHLRLQNQHLATQTLKDPVAVLRSLVAVQAQDYYGAKWALAQRTTGCTDERVEKAFTEGKILRLHVMRPTWHFVTPEDIRWLVTLTAPRVNVASSHAYRIAELDQSTFKITNKAITKALQGGRHLTRAELREVVARAGVNPGDSMRLGYIMHRAELDLVICSGARRGNQFTYALLDERAPKSKTLEADEALGELTERYFSTRGPATLNDYVWWSGLTKAQANKGIEIAGRGLRGEIVDDKTYFSGAKRSQNRTVKGVFLLPTYDEYFIAYKDRSAGMHPQFSQATAGQVIFNAPIVIDGRVVGGWKRALERERVRVEIKQFLPFSKSERASVRTAVQQYANFLQSELSLDWL